MKKAWRAVLTIICGICVFLSTACELEQSDFSLEPRIALETSGVYFMARVFLEGAGGQGVTGAVVYVINPANAVTLLEYDYTKGCFTGSPGAPQTGLYQFVVDSKAFGIVERQVFFSVLSGRPAITAFTSADGNDIFAGDPLSAGTAATLSWNEVAGATVYRVEIENEFGAVVQSSSTSQSILLDSSIFDSTGSYSISVTAQFVSGDPLFREYDYYAVNEEEGATLYFEVE